MNTTHRRSALAAILLSIALTASVAAPASADNDPLIADGNFEGSWNMSPFRYIAGESLGAWNVVSGEVSATVGGPGPTTGVVLEHYPPVVVDFLTDSPTPFLSAISQLVPTTAGTTYKLTFWVSGDGKVQVIRDGTAVDTFTAPAAGAWHSTSFVAASSLTALTLQSYWSGPATGYSAVFLDNLLMLPDSPIVEPAIAACALVIGLGCAVLYLVRRRRLNHVDAAVA